MTAVTTTDPRTGTTSDTELRETTPEEVAALTALAATAAPEYAGWTRDRRADLLEAMSDAVERRRPALVAVAAGETGLGEERLHGELGRSRFQLSLMAEAVREGGYLEAMVDRVAETPLGPQPDVRRMLVPLGPVAIFGASNFPFAFSVLGGDVASALAVGCPVVVKGHDSHPLTSRLSFGALTDALRGSGAPEGVLGLVLGQSAGSLLVARPEIRAVGFTGSTGAAEALQEAMAARAEPVPFYGELSSVNPLVVTHAAAEARGEEVARGLFASVTGSGGQLCTKPGVAFVPSGAAGDAMVDTLAGLVSGSEGAVLLNERVRDAFVRGRQALVGADGVRLLAEGPALERGYSAPATLLLADRADPAVLEECFGPLLVAVRYDALADVADALADAPGSLTLTVHLEPADQSTLAELQPRLARTAGRLIFDGFPTGVRVSWAQTHGGPWPATNTHHTSVGVTSVRRWLRPMSWQSAPEGLLPPELRDGAVPVPRRVDGVLRPARR